MSKVPNIDMSFLTSLGLAGKDGIYTPVTVAQMDPAMLSMTLNNLVAHVNLDKDRIYRRRMLSVIFVCFVVGLFVGAGAAYAAVAVMANPVEKLTEELRRTNLQYLAEAIKNGK